VLYHYPTPYTQVQSQWKSLIVRRTRTASVTDKTSSCFSIQLTNDWYKKLLYIWLRLTKCFLMNIIWWDSIIQSVAWPFFGGLILRDNCIKSVYCLSVSGIPCCCEKTESEKKTQVKMTVAIYFASNSLYPLHLPQTSTRQMEEVTGHARNIS